MAAVRARVLVSGLVQGVFFRQKTAERARQRGLSGFVRNLPDGRVEAVFEGGEDGVRGLVEWCHDGPRGARVEAVDVEWGEPTGEFDGFDLRW